MWYCNIPHHGNVSNITDLLEGIPYVGQFLAVTVAAKTALNVAAKFQKEETDRLKDIDPDG